VKRDRRRLGPEEEELWAAVKRTVEPLRPEPAPAPLHNPVPEAPPPPTSSTAAPAQKPLPPARPPLPALHALGRRERQKVARGQVPIDGRIDLHGLTQTQAHDRLSGFLARAQADGCKVVLVITGKGRTGGGFDTLHEPERGVLKRVVPLWLSLPEFRRYILGFEEAHLAHGGGGALYVRIRRRKA
jgi:DNA-nicking Smr family endonuclease